MSEPVPFGSAAGGAVRTAWSVRPARPGDAEAWHALQATIYAEGRAFVGDGAPAAGALAARLRALHPDQGVVLFAVAAGPPIAWAEAYRLGSRRLAHVAMLTIAVADGWRGRGVGTALMEAIETWARRSRVRKLQLHVRAGNHEAIALYRRLGYAVEGVLVGQVAADGGFEDEWVMARALTAEAG